MQQNLNDFIKLAASLKISFSINSLPENVNTTIKKLKKSEIPPIIYLKGVTCSGCSVSLINFTKQSPSKLIINHENLTAFKGSVSSQNIAIELMKRYLSGKIGPYYFALEGSIPKNNPLECYMDNRPITDWVKKAGKTCLMALSFGNCACNGNIKKENNSNLKHLGLDSFFKLENIDKKVINIYGCPIDPKSVWNLIINLVETTSADLPIQTYKKYAQKNM